MTPFIKSNKFYVILQNLYGYSNNHRMEAHQSIGNYKIVSKIGEGSFGQIYQVTQDNITYAIKTENIDNIKPMVGLQYQILKELQKRNNIQQSFGFPKVYQYKQQDHFSYMVMEKLDTTLQDLVNLDLQNQLQKDVLIIIMYSTFKCLRSLHQIGYLYRDVKPSNFMVRKKQIEQNRGRVYLIDLGLCKKYTKNNSTEHIALKSNKKMIGTPIFCSVNTHHGLQNSRRDDLESWVYMVIYLVKKLPWELHSAQSLPSQTINNCQTVEAKQTASQKIGKLKQSTDVIQMIRQQAKLPNCLIKIFEHIRHLQFETRPDYDLIQKWMGEDYDKLTGSKGKIASDFIKIKGGVKQAVESKSNIKINFKVPLSNKLKKKNIEDININKILQK